MKASERKIPITLDQIVAGAAKQYIVQGPACHRVIAAQAVGNNTGKIAAVVQGVRSVIARIQPCTDIDFFEVILVTEATYFVGVGQIPVLQGDALFPRHSIKSEM